jgi:type IV pilus assembly protein PilC
MLRITEVEQRSVFFREMATMVQSGMTMGESLEAAGRGTRHWRLARAAEEGAKAARLGKPFSQTMGRYPDVFTPVESAMVRAAEHSGRLDRLLGQIAAYLETEYSLRQMISRETFYPKILFGAILAFLLFVPAIIAALRPGGGALAGFLVLFQALLGWGILAFTVFVIYAIFRHALISSRETSAAWDTLKLKIPVFGEAIRRLALARFSRGLAALYAAGVSLAEASEIASDLTANAALREPMKTAAVRIHNGETPSQAFAGIPAMDDMTLRMLQTGEQTGNIDAMMQRVAEHYEEASLSTVRRAAALTVPVATVIAGVIVLFIALRAYTGAFGGYESYLR